VRVTYRLRVEAKFDAVHELVGCGGKCARLHGHVWKMEIFVVGDKLNKFSISEDFNLISENISRYIYESLKNRLNVKLEKVRVWEDSNSWCEYHE